MRIVTLLIVLTCTACSPLYGRDVANFTAFPEDLPAVGTSASDLDAWFEKLGYAPASDVWQSESQLRRAPGAPLVYAVERDKIWWKTRARTVRDFCTTQKFIYYRLDTQQRLERAIQNKRSVC